MENSYKFEVLANEKRLDVFLSKHLNLSRTKVSFLILNSCVKINNKIILKNNIPLKVNDLVEAKFNSNIFQSTTNELKPYNLKLDVVYEDEDLIIINKPKNLITHPTTHNNETTLVNALINHLNKFSSKKENNHIYMVHRLDKNTTGLIIAAKNFKALSNLQEQIKSREMKRFYLAIVNYPFNELMGTIDAPIGRINGSDSIKFTVINAKNPKKSITKFYVLDQTNRYALIKCELLTGRTHQIRVHMSFIEHWILNDPLYGIKGQNLNNEYNQYLHAYQLEFIHPTLNKKLFFECNLDQEFNKKLKELNLSIDKSINDIEYIE
ncbi:RluA family pseudouridine synthase [Mycoplasmoides pirum]|uniref:RluA family pseudouridine synthase n=1 Tax=Mycoplasmoides pirum TaxID=2122 RepID=UPI0004820CA4|nr:RluA family pseudouridine synthase [Mycoplasmoides pirum]